MCVLLPPWFGADVDARNDLGGQTPVHMVASRVTKPDERLACARLLVEAKANLSATDFGGRAPHEIVGERDEDFPELRMLLTPS